MNLTGRHGSAVDGLSAAIIWTDGSHRALV